MTTSERALRRMRQRIFDYDGTPNEGKATRVLEYMKHRVMRERMARREPVGPYSGLTRAELARTGTCEPDWF